MVKKQYETPEMMLVLLDGRDIITESGTETPKQDDWSPSAPSLQT